METMVLHPDARDGVERLVKSVGPAISDECAILVYGSAVRGDYDPARSDLDVLIALEGPSVSQLQALGPSLRAAWRRSRVEPYLVGRGELSCLADVFPIRVLDMQRAHVQVWGRADPLAGVEVEAGALRLRVEQELRNHLLRTRRALITAAGDRLTLGRLLRRAARSLRLELWALLCVMGHEPERMEPDAVFSAATDQLDVQTGFLRAAGDAQDLPLDARAAELLTLLERLVSVVDRLVAA